jgi:bacterioferritin|tara:strand:+ start:581 stop:1090 length:510 start_codon:yes stop_codon:yes gene_type:complete
VHHLDISRRIQYLSIVNYLIEVFIKMKQIDSEAVCRILNEIMEYELAGVVRYTHSAMMVSGPYRLPIVTFLKDQASESLAHAQQAGELIVGLDGHPSQRIAKIKETHRHSIKDILEESLAHEQGALKLYKKFLENVADRSIYLEEYARGLIGQEEQHSLELKAMLKDFG